LDARRCAKNCSSGSADASGDRLPVPAQLMRAGSRRALLLRTVHTEAAMTDPMYSRVLHATHPDMMIGVSNEQLRDRYLMTGLFASGQVVLNYSHNERMVIGGATPGATPISMPRHSEPESQKGQ